MQELEVNNGEASSEINNNSGSLWGSDQRHSSRPNKIIPPKNESASHRFKIGRPFGHMLSVVSLWWGWIVKGCPGWWVSQIIMGGSPDGGWISQTVLSKWHIAWGLKSKFQMLRQDAPRRPRWLLSIESDPNFRGAHSSFEKGWRHDTGWHGIPSIQKERSRCVGRVEHGEEVGSSEAKVAISIR